MAGAWEEGEDGEEGKEGEERDGAAAPQPVASPHPGLQARHAPATSRVLLPSPREEWTPGGPRVGLATHTRVG